jgi:serine/threonine-protein kinase
MPQVSGGLVSSAARAARRGWRSAGGVVGPWRLARLLGEGTYTQVHLAQPDDDHQAVYAVKMLRPARANDPIALKLLAREAYVGLKVSHPHVVSVLSAHVNEPPYYLVMPYLPGGTLRERLDRKGRLPVAIATWIARQVAQGLAALHSAGFLHGDVKPANIFLSPEGHATLIDLGFAHSPRDAIADDRRSVKGTLDYLAPEATLSSSVVDARSDFYSLGVTLFEMLCGRRPFSGDAAEVVRLHREAIPPDLRELSPSVPATVAEFVARLLAKQPIRRPASSHELVDQLSRLEIATLGQRVSGSAP